VNVLIDLDLPEMGTVISSARFATYLTACGQDSDVAVRLYAWNLELSAAMWGGLGVLEVVARNALDCRLQVFAGQMDWWNSAAVALRIEQSQAISRAGGGVGPHSGNHGQVVAALTLGFWTSLLANRYHQSLWIPALAGAFPNYVGRRGDLHQKLEGLRRLRNRIAHHEPIINMDIAVYYQDVLAILAAIDPKISNWVDKNSRVNKVLAAKSFVLSGLRPTSF